MFQLIIKKDRGSTYSIWVLGPKPIPV